MANASPNARGPNATYIFYQLTFGLVLGTIGSRWALLVGGSCWVRKAFQIPTCWYSQCEIIVLGV